MGSDGRMHCRVIGKAHGEGILEGWAAAESVSGDLQLKPIVGAMFTKVEMRVTGSAVSVRPWLSPDGEDAALLRLLLSQLYAWEATGNGNGFCFRLSEDDADVSKTDELCIKNEGLCI